MMELDKDNAMESIEKFVGLIASVNDEGRNIINPYRDVKCRYNLTNYLSYLQQTKIDIMLIGEAPGYRGCAVTGIPFTDEIQLLSQDNYYALGTWVRDTKTGRTSERTATSIWRELRKYHLIALMWNVFPFHPYKESKEKSNRTPTPIEIQEGTKYVEPLISLFSIHTSQIFSIGKKAQSAFKFIDDSHTIRHPANDFKKEFAGQFDSKIGSLFKDRLNSSL